VQEPRALAVRRRQRNTEEGPRELSLPKVTSRGGLLLAPRHSQLNRTIQITCWGNDQPRREGVDGGSRRNRDQEIAARGDHHRESGKIADRD
jgi:hypothetical protein